VSVVFGTATIGLLYLLGRDLFSPSHGLLGALFLACTFLHVRDSALATVDALAGFFVLLALVGAGSVLRGGGRGAYLLAGAAAGLATATKYNAIVVLTGLVVAHGLRTVRSGLSFARALVVPSLLGGFVIAGVVFLAVNPYLILDWPKARADLAWQFERVRVGQVVGQPIDVGPAWWYHFTVSLRYGMGVAMLGLAVLGAVAATWRRHPGAWVSGSFAASSFVVVGSAKLAFVRYMTPLLPVLCLFAAGAVLILAGRVPWRRGRPWVVAGLAGLAVAEPLAAITAYSGMVHHTDTRVQAYRFLLTLPPDSDVATYGPSEVWRSTFPPARFWGPTYYAKHPQQTWEDVFGALKAQGSNYLLVHTASLEAYSPTVPDLERALRHSAVLVQTFSPYRPGAEVHPVYDRADPFYFPVGRFRGVIRPGPLIRLYRLG
jgi:4-amino-4-deoxy-L-arabinose transferase-like glycosyltransferase